MPLDQVNELRIEKKIEETHSKIKFDKYEIWALKEYAEEIQEKIDSLIVIASLMGYNIDISMYYRVLSIYISNQRIKIINIKFHINNEKVIYHMNVHVRVNSNHINSDCHDKYKKFVKFLQDVPRFL